MSDSKTIVRPFTLDHAPTLKEAWYDPHRIIGVKGPVSSGKSSFGVELLLKWALMQKPMSDGVHRSKWALVRATYEELRKTTLETLQYWLGHIGHYHSNDKAFYAQFTDPKLGTYELTFLAMGLERPEDKEKIGSLEVTGALVEEAREIPYPIIDTLKQRINRFPPKQEGGATRPGLVMITNAPPEKHWWYDLAEKRSHTDPDIKKFFKFYSQPAAYEHTVNDEGGIVVGNLNPKRENQPFIDVDYYPLILAGASDDTIRTQLLNLYGKTVAGCPVYGNDYRDAIHFNPNMKFVPGLPVWRGWDFGRRPCCVFAQVDPKGHLNLFFELTSNNTGITAFKDRVVGYCRGTFGPDQVFFDVGDPTGNFAGQNDDTTPYMILQGAGIMIQPAISNEVGVRLEAVRRGLTTHLDGRPIIQVGPQAELVRDGFNGGYRYEQIKGGELAGDYRPKPVKDLYSDPQDCVQYIALAVLGAAVMTGASVNTKGKGAGTVAGGAAQDHSDIPAQTNEPDADGFYF